jgi:hypothetical protein
MIIRPGAQAGAPSQRRVEEAVARAEAVAPPPMRAAGGARGAAAAAPAASAQPRPIPGKAALPRAKLQVLSGVFAGKELELTKALTTLGRPGVQVAAVTRRAEGYFIVHVDSGEPGNYPKVNGKAIGPQARKLSNNDVIELAGVKMGFFNL